MAWFPVVVSYKLAISCSGHGKNEALLVFAHGHPLGRKSPSHILHENSNVATRKDFNELIFTATLLVIINACKQWRSYLHHGTGPG